MSMPKPQAFLALWNSITSDRSQAEYESWHSFEHVPERVGLPGFVEATRYRSVTQPLRYFTCYSLQSLDALETPEYRDVFTNPTPWSARMRSVLCDFYRSPCRVGGVHGAGSANQIATLQWRSASFELAEEMNNFLQTLVMNGALIRAEWGISPPSEEYWLPNTVNELKGMGQDYVVVLQHLDVISLKSSMQSLVDFLKSQAASVGQPEYFQQLTNVRQDELDSSPSTRRSPHATLFDQFNGE